MYGMIYVADGAAAQTISGTPAKMTGFATLGPSSHDRQGELDVLPVVASDKLTLKAGGIYQVGFHLSASGSGAGDCQAAIRLGSVEQAHLQSRVALAASNAEGTLTIGGFVEVGSADADLEVYLEGASIDVTPIFAQLWARRIE